MSQITDNSNTTRITKLRRIMAAKGPTIPAIMGSIALDAAFGKVICCDSYIPPPPTTIPLITTPPPFATPDQVPAANAMIVKANRFIAGVDTLGSNPDSFSLAALLLATSVASNVYPQLSGVPSQTLTYNDSVSLQVALRSLPGKTFGNIALPIYAAIPSNNQLPEPPPSGSYFAAVNTRRNATYTYENSADTLRVNNGVQTFQSATLGNTDLTLGGSYTLTCTNNIYTLVVNYLGSNNSNISFVPVTAPPLPINVTVSPGNASATLTFATGYNGGTPITTYLYSTDGVTYIDTNRAISPLTITGLTNGTTYTITLKAVNRIGPGDPSVPVTVTPSSNVPLPLISVSTVVENGSVSATVVYGDASQRVQYFIEGVGSGQIYGTTGTIALYNGATFVIYLAAANNFGISSQTRVTVTLPPVLPVSPTNLDVLPSNGAAIIVFTPGYNGGSPITTYLYSTDGVTYNDTNQAISPLTITGLTNDVAYTITLKAKTAYGESLPTQSVTVTPNSNAPLPLAAVSAVIGLTEEINAEVVYSDASIESIFIVADTAVYNVCEGTSFSFSGGSLETLTFYSCARNEYGVSSLSDPITVLPTNILPPTPITGYNSYESAILVFYQIRPTTPVTSYLYSLDGGDYIDSGQSTSPLTISGLTNGQTYTITLKAVTAGGTSDPSDPVTVTPNSNAPAALTNAVATPGYEQTTVSFTDPSGTNSYQYFYNIIYISFTTNPYTIDGLRNGSITTIYLAAVDASDPTIISNLVSVTVTPSSTAVNPPSELIGYNSFESAIITFYQSITPSPVTSYLYSVDGGDYIDSGQSASPITITGLTNGQTYTITLKTVAANVPSNPSDAITVTPSSNAPAPLTNVVAIPGYEQATVSFTAPIGITEFLYSSNRAYFISFTTNPYVIAGLTNDEVNTIYLAAVDGSDPNIISNLVSVTVTPSSSIVNPPADLTGYNSFSSAIILFRQSITPSPVTRYLYSVDGGDYIDSGQSTSPLTISGLTNGRTYTITLKAETSLHGISEPSASITVTPSSNAPAALTDVVAIPGYGQATVSFTAPVGITEFGYSDDGITFYQFSTNPYVITGLTNDQVYTIYLAAVDSINTNIISNLVLTTVTPSSTVVNPPSELTGYKSFESAIITFTQTNTPSPVTSYLYSVDGGADIDSGQSASPITITGLTNGQTYTITLKTVAANVPSNPSFPITVTPSSNAPAPLTNVVAIPGYEQATVSFTAPVGITEFLYSDNGITFIQFITNPYVITGLTNDQVYTIYLAAVDSNNTNIISNLVSVTVTPSSTAVNPPYSLTGYNSFESAIITFYQSITPSPVTSYLYSVNGGADIDSGQSRSPLTITGLTNGTPYTITLKAETSLHGISEPSFLITVTPSSNAPAALTNVVAIPGYEQATVSFTDPSGTNRYQYSSDGGFYSFATNPYVTPYLENGTTVTIYLAAVDISDPSIISNLVSVTVTPSSSIINPPSYLTGYNSFESAIIIFTQSITPSPVTSYLYSVNGGADIDSGRSTSPLTITGLTNGTPYTITLKTETSLHGTSEASFPITVTPSSNAPAALTNVVATPGYEQATVSFTDPSGTNRYLYSSNGFTFYQFTTNPYVTPYLANGTTYTIYLAAVDSNNTNIISNLVLTTVTPSSTAVNPPSYLTEYNSFESAIITFTQGNTPSPVTRYLYSVDGGADIDSGQSRSPLTITGLTNGTPYTITLKTETSLHGISEPSASITVTPSSNAPAPLTNVVATPGYEQATVSFTDPSGTNRYLYLSYGDYFNSFTTNPYVITSLANGTTYTIYLAAVDSINTTIISNLVLTTVTPTG